MGGGGAGVCVWGAAFGAGSSRRRVKAGYGSFFVGRLRVASPADDEDADDEDADDEDADDEDADDEDADDEDADDEDAAPALPGAGRCCRHFFSWSSSVPIVILRRLRGDPAAEHRRDVRDDDVGGRQGALVGALRGGELRQLDALQPRAVLSIAAGALL
ncbi:MAG: hypothetical protein FJ137_02770 [Deltaproteobacteria bacterium]|nr:hypothetical protein [Deltaproteobacteria bacterium]